MAALANAWLIDGARFDATTVLYDLGCCCSGRFNFGAEAICWETSVRRSFVLSIDGERSLSEFLHSSTDSWSVFTASSILSAAVSVSPSFFSFRVLSRFSEVVRILATCGVIAAMM